MGGLNVTDVRRERIPLLWRRVGERTLGFLKVEESVSLPGGLMVSVLSPASVLLAAGLMVTFGKSNASSSGVTGVCKVP